MATQPVVQSPEVINTTRTKLWLLDGAMLAAYASFVLVGVTHHEPWADEAQAWVMARDLPLGKLLFNEMHYEVSPGLWHAILWVAQHFFHAPYAAIDWIGAVFAIAGAALLIFCAPFPRIVRYLMASSFYISYQYAVIARPYVMLLLFAAGAAIFYRRRQPIAMAICVALLTLVSIHGAILAGGITVAAIWRGLRNWKTFTHAERRNQLIGLLIVFVGVNLLLASAYPAPDIIVMNTFGSGAIHKFLSVLEYAVLRPWYAAVPLLAILTAFVVWRREALVLVLGVGGVVVFQAFFYGGPHHEGAIVVALITALWMAYPSPGEALPTWYKPQVLPVLLCIIFATQTWWAVRAWRYDYANPYSGAADMARFMHEIGAKQDETSGFSYFVVALQPYFDHNIFTNWPTAYVHHSRDAEPPLWKMRDENLTRYIVMPSLLGDDDPTAKLLIPQGYVKRHVSPGRLLFAGGLWSTETFTLYEKVR